MPQKSRNIALRIQYSSKLMCCLDKCSHLENKNLFYCRVSQEYDLVLIISFIMQVVSVLPQCDQVYETNHNLETERDKIKVTERSNRNCNYTYLMWKKLLGCIGGRGENESNVFKLFTPVRTTRLPHLLPTSRPIHNAR